MGLSDIEAIRDQYAAVNERDWKRVMDYYAEDVVLVVTNGIMAGTFEGREALGKWFGDWFSTFARDAHFDLTEITALDDDGAPDGMDGTCEALAPLAERHRANREAWVAALAGPSVDRASLERLRQEELALAEAASQQLVTALADVSEALTPEQRAKLVALGRRFHDDER